MTQVALITELPKQPGGAPRPLTYLATRGITKCGVCSWNMEGKPSSRKVRGYACSNKDCRRTRIVKDAYEEYLGVQVLARIAHPESVPLLSALLSSSAPTGRAIAEEIGQLEDELRELGRDLGAGRIDRLVAQEAQAVFVDRLRELRELATQLAAVAPLEGFVTPEFVTVEQLERWWSETSTIEERHALLKVLIDEVRILPTQRLGFHNFDDRRVEIVWAAG